MRNVADRIPSGPGIGVTSIWVFLSGFQPLGRITGYALMCLFYSRSQLLDHNFMNCSTDVDGGEPVFYELDVFGLNGQHLLDRPLLKRKRLLRSLIPKQPSVLLHADLIEPTASSSSA